jgi:hypothetical protein
VKTVDANGGKDEMVVEMTLRVEALSITFDVDNADIEDRAAVIMAVVVVPVFIAVLSSPPPELVSRQLPLPVCCSSVANSQSKGLLPVLLSWLLAPNPVSRSKYGQGDATLEDEVEETGEDESDESDDVEAACC